MKLKTIIAMVCSFGVIGSAHASMALAVPQNASCKAGQNTSVKAMYQYTIVNPTSSNQNYSGYEQLKVDGKVWRNPIYFSLGAYGKRSVGNDFGVLGYKCNRAGDLPIEAEIIIAGMGGAAHKARATLHATN